MGVHKISALSVYLFDGMSILRKSVYSKKLNRVFWKLNYMTCSSPEWCKMHSKRDYNLFRGSRAHSCVSAAQTWRLC